MMNGDDDIVIVDSTTRPFPLTPPPMDELLPASILFAVVLAVYGATLAPSIAGGDRSVNRDAYLPPLATQSATMLSAGYPRARICAGCVACTLLWSLESTHGPALAMARLRTFGPHRWTGLSLFPPPPPADSGELVAEACHLGTAHPPGYPLFTLLVSLVVRWRRWRR